MNTNLNINATEIASISPEQRVRAFVARYPLPPAELFGKTYIVHSATKEANGEKIKGFEMININDRDDVKFTTEYKGNEIQGYSGRTWYSTINPGNYVGKNSKSYYKAGQMYKCAFANYDKELGVMEISMAILDARISSVDHRWHYFDSPIKYGGYDSCYWDRTFLVKGDGKNSYNKEGIKNPSYHVKNMDGKEFSFMMGDLNRFARTATFGKNFSNFVDGLVIGSNGRVMNPNYIWSVQHWFKSLPKEKPLGKSGLELQNLNSKVNEFNFNANIWSSPDYAGKSCCAVYEEFGNPVTSVIRFATANQGISNRKFIENFRIFITDKGKVIRSKLTSNGLWISGSKLIDYTMNRLTIYGIEKATNAVVKYAMSTAIRVNTTAIEDIMSIIKYPVCEKLVKLGYTNMVGGFIKDGATSSSEQKYFGGFNKSKNLFAFLGATKEQLDFIEKFSLDQLKTNIWLGTIKQALGTKTLQNIQIEEFKTIVNSLSEFKRTCYGRLTENLELLKLNLGPKTKTFWIRMFNTIRTKERQTGNGYYNYQQNEYNILNDMVIAYKQLPEAYQQQFDFTAIKSRSDLVRLHDSAVNIMNTERQKINALRVQAQDAKMKEINKERREKYNCEGENFIFKIPESCAELVTEGFIQHICIGGYVDRYANGSTDLIFLRKKTEPDVPFYAIEIRNNTLIQIHGFGNKWLGNNPEAIPFVAEWLKKLGCSYNKNILLCTAHGYLRVNGYLDAAQFGL